MTVFASAGAVEEGLAGVSVPGEQFLDRIPSGNAGGLERFFGAFVEKRGDVGNLFIVHICESRHAFIGATAANHFANLVALDVMRDERRADQIRSTSASGVRAVAESAGIRKLLATALDSGIFGNGILRGGLRARGRVPETEEERKC